MTRCDLVDLRVDPVVAAEIASTYMETPSSESGLTRAAYGQLARESDQLFRALTSDRPDRVQVVFTTSTTPYACARELIASVREDRVLEVVTVRAEPDRAHPLMDCEIGGTYDRFRAVHDVLGHAQLEVGFDRHGEYAAWRFQERFHSKPAQWALATELHAQHSVRWTTGDVAETKTILLDRRLLRRARLGGRTRPRKLDFWR